MSPESSKRSPESPESSKRCLFLLAHVSNMYRNKSPLMNPIIGTLVVRVVLVGCSQPIMARRGQGRLVFESRLWPFRPFWSTLRTVLRSTLEPKPPRRSFPSATVYPNPGYITPSTAIRPRVMSRQVLKVANFALCPNINRQCHHC